MRLKPFVTLYFNNSWINPTATDRKHISSAFIAVHFSELKKKKSSGGL
jgi:hypothetical protein